MVANNAEVEREKALIVGAGPIGIACAISAKRRGSDPLLIDAGAVVHSIVRFPVQMVFFTTPDLLEIGGHPFPCAGEKPTRAEALKYYRGVVRSEEIRVRTWTKLLSASRQKEGIACALDSGRGEETVFCERLILATGYYDNPNMLEVPGEDLPHVSHYYDEGHLAFRRYAVVVGGGNSAIEAALDLHRSGAWVTVVHREDYLKKTAKYWIRPDIENRIKEGSIAVRYETQVVRIEEERVLVRNREGGEEWLNADRVYLLTGYRPDTELFDRIGIAIDMSTGRPAHNHETHETNVPGVYLAGSIVAGNHPSEIFIENGRFDGEKIFGATGSNP